jgi:hypothetical protein
MIGLPEQLVGIFAVLGSNRNADARTDIDGSAGNLVGRSNGLEQATRESGRFRTLLNAHLDDELVSPQVATVSEALAVAIRG